jgi:hypothetical protein
LEIKNQWADVNNFKASTLVIERWIKLKLGLVGVFEGRLLNACPFYYI